VVAIAQQANVVVYFAPITERGWVDAITQIVADTTNDPGILSISWGWAELEADADLEDPGPWPFEWTQQAFNQMRQRLPIEPEIIAAVRTCITRHIGKSAALMLIAVRRHRHVGIRLPTREGLFGARQERNRGLMHAPKPPVSAAL